MTRNKAATLAGMLIITYSLYWVFERLFRYHKEIPQIGNIFSNLGTMLRIAIEHGYGEELMVRLVSPPAEFERQIRRTFGGRVEEPHA